MKKPPLPNLRRTIRPQIQIKTSVFSQEDEKSFNPAEKPEPVKAVIQTSYDIKEKSANEEGFDKATSFDTSLLLKLWQTNTKDFNERLTPVLAKIMALLQCFVDAEQSIRSDGVDPNLELVTKRLTDDIEHMIHHRLIRLVADELFEDEKAVAELTSAMMEHLKTRSINKSSEFGKIKQLIERAAGPPDESPYGNLGVSKSYGD